MPLNSEYLACTGQANSAPTIVLLHGWASNREIWRSSLPYLRHWANVILIDLPGVATNEAYWQVESSARLALIAQAIPDKVVLIGWSLGGMLARELALQYPQKASAVITFATNSRFVEQPNMTEGTAMPEATARAFAEGFTENAGKTLKRFDLLQIQGDAQTQLLRSFLKAYRSAQGELARQQEWLAELYHLDHRSANISQPMLSFFAERDSLVPLGASSNCACEIECIPDSGHLFFISRAEQVWNRVKAFVQNTKAIKPDESLTETHPGEESKLRIDKAAMTHSFSAAAQSYDAVAELQRGVADQLFEHCPKPSAEREFNRVLDLGCGTGYSLPKLQKKSGAEAVYAMDIATGMLKKASDQSDARLLCGDAENIPLADNSVNLIFSSMALQWCQVPQRWLSEVQRVLAPNGLALITTVGTESLVELKQAWQQVDQYVHVNQFVDEQSIPAAINNTDLQLSNWQTHHQTRYYPRLRDITHELKALGAHNVNRGRPSGLTGRKRMAALIAAYDEQRKPEGLPVSWQFWTLALRKPASH